MIARSCGIAVHPHFSCCLSASFIRRQARRRGRSRASPLHRGEVGGVDRGPATARAWTASRAARSAFVSARGHSRPDSQVPTVSTIFPVDFRSIIKASASPARSSGRTRLIWGLSRPASHMRISSVMDSPMADGRRLEYEPQ